MPPSALRLSRRAVAVRHRILAYVTVVAVLLATLPLERFITLPFVQTAHAAAFTPGNVVVYRVGSGSGSLLGTGNPVFLDEFTPAGTLVQSIALPTADSGANQSLIANGTSTSEGLLTRSADGQYLVLTGYDATPPIASGTVNGATAASINRVIGRVDAAGTINTTTALADAFSTGNIRSVASTDGSTFWATGSNDGVRTTTLGSTTSTVIANNVTNLRQVHIFNNQLYVSSGSGTTRVATVGTGTPTTPGQTITNITGIPTTNSPYGFFFADLDAGVAGVDTLYVADDTAFALRKYSLVGGTWTLNGTIGVATDLYRGLTATVSGPTVTLYATRKGGSTAVGAGELVSLVDATGYNGAFSGTPTLLSTAVANTSFRGVALAPAAVESAPTVSSTTPTNGAIDIALASDITVNFSEDVTVSSNSFTITCGTSGAHTFALSGSGAAYTLNPDADFANSETCTGTVVANQVTDVDASDPPDEMAVNYVFSFTTLSATPTLTITDVSQNETDVGTTFIFTVNLSAPAPAGGVGFTINTADGTTNPANAGSDYVAIVNGSGSIAQSNTSTTINVTVGGDTTTEPNETFFVNLTGITGATPGNATGLGTILNDDVSATAIHDIQGSGDTSPLNGQTLSTTGIVTLLKTGSNAGGAAASGFFIQTPDANADADPNTSEGIFVFTSSVPTVSVGDSVTVTGTVVEFTPAGYTGTTTEISPVTSVILVSSGNPLPTPITLDSTILSPTALPTQPQLEKYEGMRMAAASLKSVAPNDNFYDVYTVLSSVPRPLREPGIPASDPIPPDPTSGTVDCCIPIFDENPERIKIDTNARALAPNAAYTSNVTFTNVSGPLDFGFSEYRLIPDSALTASANISAVPVPVPTASEFTVAGQNIENFANNATQRQKAALAIRTIMLLPDIIGMVEINNLTSLQALATQVNNDTLAATGTNPNYVAYLIPAPTGGTQHLGFLVKSSRVQVDSVTQERAGDTYIQPSTGTPDETHDRPPLVLRAHIDPTGANLPVIVVVNHPRSFIDIDLVAGTGLNVRAKRKAQGESLASLFQELQTNNPTTSVIGVGDYNAYEFNDGYTDPISVILGNPTPDDQIVVDASPDVVNPNFVNLINEVTTSERYSFIFEGNPQAIDHVLVNTVALARRTRIAISHHNADFPGDPASAFETNVSRPERNSDHDTPVAYFSTAGVPAAPNVPDLQTTSDTGTLNDDNVTSDTSPTFDITGAEPGATVELLRDGASLTPAVTGTADGSGNVTLNDPGPLSDGSYSYTVTQTTSGGTSIPSPALVVTIDTTAPTVTIDRAAGQADSTSSSPINFAVVFSEPVTNFDSSDIQVGGTAGATTALVTGSGTTYNVAVSGMTTDGTVTISFLANAATDAAGNGNAAPTVIDDSVNFSDPGAFSAFVVTNINDLDDGTCDGDCSLREAITAANSDSGAETITFVPELTGVIILQTELPALTGGTTITGPGADMMTVRRDSDALTQFRIFTLTTSEAVNISGLTISGGIVGAPGGGGIYNDGGELQLTDVIVSFNTATTSLGMGGGILSVNGSLTLTNSTVTGNNSACDGGGIDVFGGTLIVENSTISNNNSSISGGGILSFGSTTTITGSTLNGNTSVSEGGGIYNAGILELTNSTVSGNSSQVSGGGIYNHDISSATLTSVTITNNHADSNDDASGDGGGIYNSNVSPLLHNTIVAGNFKGSGTSTPATANDIQGMAVDSNSSFNLIGTGGAGGLTSGAPNNNQVGVSDPGLGSLANNGGPTQTHALQTDSPAIDAGDGFGLTTDQRGFNRPVDIPLVGNVADTSDIGSFETGNHAPINSVPGAQVTDEDTELVFSFDNGNRISISDDDAGSNPVEVTLTATSGTISLVSTEDLVFTVGDGFDDTTMTFTGSISAINSALNGLTFTPTPNYNGAASLQITTNDLGNTGAGGAQSDTDTINITVNAVNDAPVANDDAYSVNENATLNVPAPGVLSNDTDVENPTPTAVLVSTTSNGTLALNGNGSFTYTPQAGFSGTDSFTYKANDGSTDGNTATVTITVNDGGALAFSSATYNVNENDGSATITITRTGGSAGTATVLFVTSNGTATTSDYTPVSTTVTFNNGEVSKTVNITINDDTFDEANETVNLTLSNAGGTGQLGSPSAATLTINDNDAQPALSINDVTVTEGNSGTANAVFTVALSTQSGLPVTVNYQTANGTATSPSDYQAIASTPLVFSPGETSKTITVVVNGDTANEADETFFVNLSGATNATISDNQGLGTILNDDTPAVQFSSATYSISEAGSHATVTVTRTGDSSIPMTVNYASSDASGLNTCSQVTGNASQRCDYATVVGILRFAAGENSKDIIVPIIDDVHIEGIEIFTMTLSSPVGGNLGSTISAAVAITDNDSSAGTNPIDNDSFFIRQLYIDLLGRLPEPGAVNAWLGILNHCSNPTDPVNGCDRIAVAAGFLGSQEFQGRGYFVYRHYASLLGRIPLYGEFTPDMALVNGFLSSSDLEANKVAYTDIVMNRPEFKTIYDPTINNPTAFVDKLLEKSGLPNHPQRAAWISGLTNSTLTRAQVVRQLIDSSEVYNKYVKEAFVIMNYFGFLRRTADSAYQAWLDLLNQTNNPRPVIGGFINSPEYRLRFGP